MNKVQEGHVNRTRTMDLIRNNPGISRIEAAEHLRLNRSTLTHIVNDFLQEGFLREEQSGSSGEKSGRKPIGLNTIEKKILGVEWQDQFFRYVFKDLQGEILEKGRIELDDHNVDAFCLELKNLIQDFKIRNHDIKGICLALPGRVNPHRGIILESKPLDMKDFPISRYLGEALGIPVLAENDANCFAWGEIEERKNFNGNLLCMILEFHSDHSDVNWDQEVGIGIVNAGEVYHGSTYSAGELQTSPVSDSLRTQFLEVLNKKNVAVAEAPLEYCSRLFASLNPVISALDPEVLILGGDFYRHRKLLESSLNKVIPFPWKFSDKGIWEVASGAASFFIKTVFSLPGYSETALYKGDWETILK